MKSLRFLAFLRRLRKFFFTTLIGGVVVILPITLLIFMLRAVVRFTSNLLSPMRALFPFSDGVSVWLIDLISLALVITVFFLVGLVIQTRFGNQLFKGIENKWLMNLPFYPTLRDMVRQFFGMKKAPFSQVVLIDAFGSGVMMTGFISDDTPENGYITVFVPTGPNPTNGFVFHAKKEKLVYLDVRPEDAMRTIIGVGTGSSVLFQAPKSEE
ncbi:MAG: DUF502 domain-containing protein [Chitinophagales bacterium]|nr:DUF502 domain-containing protein [Chitinophagales bacterium]